MVAVMSGLSQFKESGDGPFAGMFCMDGGDRRGFPDMRLHAKMGACDCCDYFAPDGESAVFLVEKTALMETIRAFQKEFAAAPPPARDKKDRDGNAYINNRVLWETRLKTYGGMLVLHRLAAQCGEMGEILRRRGTFRLLLVDDGPRTPENETDADHWRRRLKSDLRSVFSPEMIADVNVIHIDELPGTLCAD